MRAIVKTAIFSGFLALISITGAPAQAVAPSYDGNWSVLVVTERGTCDRAYRYAVRVAHGQVRYSGDAQVSLGGTVTPEGTVRVSIRRGQQGANGSGRLSEESGAGTWHGVGSNGSCSGRWEAERR